MKQYPILEWPVAPKHRRITQFWGENPDMYARWNLRGHNGLDLGMPVGTPVRAAAAGWVREAMSNPALGNYVKVMHPWGHTVYAHLSKINVRHGQNVTAGQVIGLSGNTGNSTGPHLHFGVRINPYDRGDGWLGYSNPLTLLQHPRAGAGLAPHWIPKHRDMDDLAVMRRWQPVSMKIFRDGWTNPELMTELYRDLPDTMFIWRDWAMSEQHGDMVTDPVKTGERHAREWISHYNEQVSNGAKLDKARTIFLGINEPHVWEHEAEAIAYNIAFLSALEAEGWRGGALNLSVGWPGNAGPDTPPDWSRYKSLFKAIRRGGHYLVLHEYWDIAGPGEGWGWWAGRSLAVPENIPIIIGECGIDRHVRPNYHGTRGWTGHMDAEQYWSQLTQYEQWMMEDARIHSVQVFTYDVGSREWNTFDIRPALRWKMADHSEAIRERPRPWVTDQHTAPALPYATTTPEPPQQPNKPIPSDLAEIAARLEKLEQWAASFTS